MPKKCSCKFAMRGAIHGHQSYIFKSNCFLIAEKRCNLFRESLVLTLLQFITHFTHLQLQLQFQLPLQYQTPLSLSLSKRDGLCYCVWSLSLSLSLSLPHHAATLKLKQESNKSQKRPNHQHFPSHPSTRYTKKFPTWPHPHLKHHSLSLILLLFFFR